MYQTRTATTGSDKGGNTTAFKPITTAPMDKETDGDGQGPTAEEIAAETLKQAKAILDGIHSAF